MRPKGIQGTQGTGCDKGESFSIDRGTIHHENNTLMDHYCCKLHRIEIYKERPVKIQRRIDRNTIALGAVTLSSLGQITQAKISKSTEEPNHEIHQAALADMYQSSPKGSQEIKPSLRAEDPRSLSLFQACSKHRGIARLGGEGGPRLPLAVSRVPTLKPWALWGRVPAFGCSVHFICFVYLPWSSPPTHHSGFGS